MTARERDTKPSSTDEDEHVEWPGEVWDRAQISVGGKVVRPATGTLTKRGRPPVGDAPKQQVTLRLPRAVIEHFKAGGAGWQTRISDDRKIGTVPIFDVPDQRRARAPRRRGEAQVGVKDAA